MKKADRVGLLIRLGELLSEYIIKGFPPDMDEAIVKSQSANQWFTRENITYCLENWSHALTAEKVRKWIDPYKPDIPVHDPKKVAVIMAGNIPLVGFHDFLCVFISGHSFIGKLSAQDRFLLSAISRELVKLEPTLENAVTFTEERLPAFDAVIATGSDNTSNYFNYYFGKYPHIIRKNRNSVAILTGAETQTELECLADDIFTYFGLGCRNVTKIFVSDGNDFSNLNQAFMKYKDSLMLHNKYLNNYEYHKSIMLINAVPFIDFDFLMLKEDKQLSSPISVLHYEYYSDIAYALGSVDINRDRIQCLVAKEKYNSFTFPFGQSQKPELWDYVDGVDTMRFLVSLNS